VIDLLKRCKDSLWVRTHIDARIPDVSAAHLIDPAWLDHHRTAQRPAVPRNHYINTTRRISCDLSDGVGRDSTCIMSGRGHPHSGADEFIHFLSSGRGCRLSDT
jgi:hypothetical protein